MEDEFENALNRMRRKSTPTPDEDLLLLYGLYKQITEGNCMTPQPWRVQVQAYKRWEAWYKNWNMPRDIAMEKYIEKVNELINYK